MQRIVVAVDPSGTGRRKATRADSIGIVVAWGWVVDGLGYVLADRTCKLSPDGWGRRQLPPIMKFGAEQDRCRTGVWKNFGGAHGSEHVIRDVDKTVSYKEVVASRGKVARAEPVAALYEQGKVKHHGSMPELEDQMCNIASDGYVRGGFA